jgi:ribonuclease HII
MVLNKFYYEDNSITEIGVDEVGRGPMFGRVYTAAVILPKTDDFRHDLMKDSKKFTSIKKLKETAEYIKQNCIAYSITYEDEKSIDKNNILNATHISMHKSLKNILNNNNNNLILVDGNSFKPLTYFDNKLEIIKEYESICITGGDNKYTTIAAASILAKVERDQYIEDICKKYPKLDEYYDLLKNKGYGTKKHLDAIKEYGISKWHRKSFGICKTSNIINFN